MSSWSSREELLHQVVLLTRQGMGVRSVARSLGVARNTVRKLLAEHAAALSQPHSALPEKPARAARHQGATQVRGHHRAAGLRDDLRGGLRGRLHGHQGSRPRGASSPRRDAEPADAHARPGRDGRERLDPLHRPAHGKRAKCLADAIDDELLRGDNPAKDVRVPKRPSSDEGWTYLTPEELERLLTGKHVPVAAQLLYTIAIYTGMRQGELWGLRWDEVRLDGPQPQVTVRYSHRGPTKSGKVRHVLLLAPAREALRRWKDQCPKSKEGLVFPTVTGLRRRKSDEAGCRNRRIAEGVIEPGHKTLAGITRRVRFHDLRHTCASHLVMGTWGHAWRIEEVCALLGHSDITVTQR